MGMLKYVHIDGRNGNFIMGKDVNYGDYLEGYFPDLPPVHDDIVTNRAGKAVNLVARIFVITLGPNQGGLEQVILCMVNTDGHHAHLVNAPPNVPMSITFVEKKFCQHIWYAVKLLPLSSSIAEK